MVKTHGTLANAGSCVVQRLQQDGNQRRLPVVAVKNVGHAEDLRGLQHGAAEQREALGIVVIVAQRRAVERIAVEVRRVVDEIELHSSAHAAVEHGTEAVTVIEGNGNAGDDLARIVELGLLVTRKIDGDLVAQMGERGRQGANDIGQPAGLGKGYALGCRKGDMHETSRRGGGTSAGNAELRNGSCACRMNELAKQLSLTAELKEGQRGKDRVEEFCCRR